MLASDYNPSMYIPFLTPFIFYIPFLKFIQWIPKNLKNISPKFHINTLKDAKMTAS